MTDPRELVGTYLEGALSPGQEEELRRWLRADAGNVQTFVREVAFHRALRDEMVARASPIEVPARSAGIAGRRLGARRRFAQGSGAPLVWAGLVAAGILLSIAVLLAALGSRSGEAPPRESPAARVTERAVPDFESAPASRPGPEPGNERKEPRGMKSGAPKPTPAENSPPSREAPGDPKRRIKGSIRPAVAENRTEREGAKPGATEDRDPKRPAPPGETRVALGRLEEVQGRLSVVEGSARRIASNGTIVLAGQTLVSEGAQSRGTLAFEDGTRVELEGETEVRRLRAEGGKRAFIAKGRVRAEVARQPRTRPMVFGTPHGEATVLGTTLRITVNLEKESTRLVVGTGRVRLKRKADGRGVLVTGGHVAVAAPGVEFRARPRHWRPGQVALYLFEEGRGTVIRDASEAGPPLHLAIEDSGAVEWLPGALKVRRPTRILSTRPASKVVEACKRTGEITVEAWVTPAQTASPAGRESSRIATLSWDLGNQNFALEQAVPVGTPGDVYHVRLRSSALPESGRAATSNPGTPFLYSPRGSLSPRLTHVVFTGAAGGPCVLYVNGVERARRIIPGDLSNWNETYSLVLANERVGERPWLGTYHLLALYGRALTPEEVRAGYEAGAE